MDTIEASSLPADPNSYAEPQNQKITHFHLDWNVNFPEKKILGSVLLHVNIIDSSKNILVLDSRKLKISKVICEENGQNLKFDVAEHNSAFGSKISIFLPAEHTKKCLVQIFYSTTPSSSGLQWLDPLQTSGKKFPFLFSQCQAIHARSLMPCQDTPQVKATYSAEVTCDSNLVVLMGAIADGEPIKNGDKTTFRFKQSVAIPSYLLAVAVGDLQRTQLSSRCAVWAEKEVIDKAEYEFAETEKVLQTAESLCGPYVWGRYDMLVLPPSFPFGGMENPCLTFVTPTILAGDRSLANVVAHEICHSWSGNGVTTCSWEHFWLNEGLTMFLERKILGRSKGEPHRQLDAIEGWQHLQECIDTRGASDPLTRLVPDLHGIDPDDAFSVVPYEKGHSLLYHLEQTLGGPDEFEPFVRAYIAKFTGACVDTNTFRAFLRSYFVSKTALIDAVDWDAWLYTPGMPPITLEFDRSLGNRCEELLSSWQKWDEEEPCPHSAKDVDGLSTTQMIVFLSSVLQCWDDKNKSSPFSLHKVKTMTDLYNLSVSNNAEIRYRWLRIGIKAHWQQCIADAIKFLNGTGRMKFVRPIYRDLFDWSESREIAIKNFESQRQFMMYVSVQMVKKDLHLNEECLALN